MDTVRFENARLVVMAETARQGGIGTLGEKTLHAVVKRYLEPDPVRHEMRIGSFIVDIFTGERVYEIQTRQFRSLKPKLEALLPQYPVTIVYPAQARKWLMWIDPESGEVSSPRLSPRRGQPCDIFRELYQIKPFLTHPNLSVRILQIDLEETRLLNGWSRDRKKGSWRHDRLPKSLENEIAIDTAADYGLLMPEGLPPIFTSADFARCARVSQRLAQTSINVLQSMGCLSACGKQGRLRLYSRSVQAQVCKNQT